MPKRLSSERVDTAVPIVYVLPPELKIVYFLFVRMRGQRHCNLRNSSWRVIWCSWCRRLLVVNLTWRLCHICTIWVHFYPWGREINFRWGCSDRKVCWYIFYSHWPVIFRAVVWLWWLLWPCFCLGFCDRLQMFRIITFKFIMPKSADSFQPFEPRN